MGGKGSEEKKISKRLQESFERVKDIIFLKKCNNITEGDVEDFSIEKYDLQIVNFLVNEKWSKQSAYSYLRDTLKYLFTNEVSRDMYLNQKDFNLNEFKLKLIDLNKNINLNFEVEAVITINENGEMLYKKFIFNKIECNENFVEMVLQNRKKLEKLQDSFERITGEYNSQYQTLKEKMFEDIEKLFEEEKEEENI
jgi:hypothetical protein